MKNHITNLYPRDIQFLTTLSRVGCIDHAQAHTFLRDKRIDGYLKDKLLERERVSVPNHRDEDRSATSCRPPGGSSAVTS